VADIAPFTTMSSFLTSRSSLDQLAGGFSIVDSLANIRTNLAALQADAGHINAVTPIDGVIAVDVATFTADQPILNKFAGGFAVVDTGSAVLAQIAALQSDAGQITTVTLSDSTVAAPSILTLSAANAANDVDILANIVSPYVLAVVNASGTTVTGHGSGLTIGIAAAITASSGNGNGTSVGGPLTITGGAKGDTFSFAAHFGVAEITDFASYYGNATPDTISLSKTDFADWATLVADGHASGANTTFVAADGASLTVDGISLSSFQHAGARLQSEFKFHA
jgi:hypothetical protein